MKKLLGCLILSLGLMSSNSMADEGGAKLYIGGGISDGTVDITNGGDKSLGTISAMVGFRFIDYLGIELAVGSGTDQSDSILSDPLVSYAAAMLRLSYQWERTEVYIVAGQAIADIDSQFNNTDAGNAFGFGINLFGNETTALNLNFLDIDSGAFQTATIGFQYFFGGFK